MKLEGGCYCGAVRYVAEGEPMLKAQCHCRECQYITGGAPNMFVAMPPDGFKYTRGAPKQFSRKDLEKPVTREFCAECGTHVVTKPQRPIVVIKVGTLDDPAAIMPQIAIYTVDKQPFHHVPEGMPAFAAVDQAKVCWAKECWSTTPAGAVLRARNSFQAAPARPGPTLPRGPAARSSAPA